jgi:hypothetical protein
MSLPNVAILENLRQAHAALTETVSQAVRLGSSNAQLLASMRQEVFLFSDSINRVRVPTHCAS